MIKARFISLAIILAIATGVHAQDQAKAKYKVCMDVAHGEKFWHDPSDMAGMDPNFIARVKYMTAEFSQSISAANAQLSYLKAEITPDQLSTCNVLFIHIPSAKYSPGEVRAITNYINNGGALFLVMEEDYWSTLEQTNVNDFIQSVGIQFAGNSPDSLSGGVTKKTPVTPTELKIPCHGPRIVKGGTPFAFNLRSETNPIGVYKELKNGGRLIVMGEGMVSLYMTEWEGVKGYQCQEFMQEAFRWLLKLK